MLKLGRVTKLKMLFLVLVFVFNFDLFKFSAAILEKGLLAQNCFTEFLLSVITTCNTRVISSVTQINHSGQISLLHKIKK